MSTLFLRTLREDPADVELPSHRLLLRAGYLRRVAPGNPAWLPLGRLLLDRVAQVIREELTAIGDQETLFPTLLPTESYQTSGRLAGDGDRLLTLRDRRGADHLLVPGHEEIAALLVRDTVTSYRDLPVTLFGIQPTYRHDPRPRSGLLRGHEVLTAAAYSFDLDESGLRAGYDRHRAAYQRIFDRLGLPHRVVAAGAGAAVAESFLAPTPAGEESFAACAACGYAAVPVAVTTPATPPGDIHAHPPAEVHDTPDTPTIDSLVELANARRLGGRADWTAADTLKNVVVTVRRPGAEPDELLVVGVPGDREVDLARLDAALAPATTALYDWSAADEDAAQRPDLVRGYIGPQVLAKLGIRYLVDPRVAPGTAWLTGANEPGRHAINVVCGRDFVPDGTIEAAEIRSGDPCPACRGGILTMQRGIELGQVRQLGRRYSDAFGVDVLGPEGKPVRPVLGRYAIGVLQTVVAIAEQHHDDRGLRWPAAVAPCDVHLVAAGKGAQVEGALELAGRLVEHGLRVLVDDRTHVSAGVKFADAELIGIPRAVVVGRRWPEGYVELRDRATGERTEVTTADLIDRLC